MLCGFLPNLSLPTEKRRLKDLEVCQDNRLASRRPDEASGQTTFGSSAVFRVLPTGSRAFFFVLSRSGDRATEMSVKVNWLGDPLGRFSERFAVEKAGQSKAAFLYIKV